MHLAGTLIKAVLIQSHRAHKLSSLPMGVAPMWLLFQTWIGFDYQRPAHRSIVHTFGGHQCLSSICSNNINLNCPRPPVHTGADCVPVPKSFRKRSPLARSIGYLQYHIEHMVVRKAHVQERKVWLLSVNPIQPNYIHEIVYLVN